MVGNCSNDRRHRMVESPRERTQNRRRFLEKGKSEHHRKGRIRNDKSGQKCLSYFQRKAS